MLDGALDDLFVDLSHASEMEGFQGLLLGDGKASAYWRRDLNEGTVCPQPDKDLRILVDFDFNIGLFEVGEEAVLGHRG